MAVGGVALALVALLSVTEAPQGSPLLAEQPPVAAPAADDAPQETVEPAGTPAAAPSTAASAATPAAPTPPAATPPAAAAPAPSAAAARPAAPAGARAAAPTTPAAAPPPRRAPVRPAVAVLNNSQVTGLAARAAARVERAGWPVRLVGNFRGQLRATTLYHERGQRAAAQRFAAGVPGVQRVLPRPANIPGPRGLVLVVTRDYA